MDENICWDHFLNSGSIRDYLDYKQMETKKGVDPYAGNHERYRDDIKDGAYRGI